MTGVGGAYVAFGEGTEGSAVNAAAPAVRVPYSTTWFDYDLSAGASLPGAFSRTDFDNHGDFANLPSHARAGDFVDLTVGGTLQFGRAGVAATGDLQEFTLTTSAPGAPGLSMQIGRWSVLGAYALWNGQLAVGGGARILTLQVNQSGGGTLLTMTGLSPEAGALLMPTGTPWRLGATVRGQVSGNIFGSSHATVAADGARTAGAFVLPSQIVMPWEVEFGAAYQLGPRPLNPGFQDPSEQEAYARAHESSSSTDGGEAERERLHRVRKARYANWPRERILLLASVLLTGPSANAVSVEGFLDQRIETVGRALSATPRFGLEGEPLRDRLLVRVGTYVEPSRYDGGSPRQHFTFGGDVRLFAFDFWGLFPNARWKLSTVLDIAPRYTNGGLGLSLWH